VTHRRKAIIINRVCRTETFDKLYKKKSKKAPSYVIRKVDLAILNLTMSKWPERLGRPKHGPLAGLLGYEVDDSNRILYEVDRYEEGVLITLHRVCSHKQVYGQD
jgi:hypothetical protein